MISTEKRRLAALMAFHTLWGLVLWFSISKYGLGISTDSVHLLFGALNFSQGGGLTSFDGSFVLNWPPLYPILIAFVQLTSGSNPFVSALILQVLAFIGLSFCFSVLFLKIFPGNFWLAFAGNFLLDVGAVVLTGFTIVGSDYIHLFFVVLFVLLAGLYMESNSPRLLLGMSVVGMLAMLQRYVGVAAIMTGMVVILFNTRAAVRQRLGRSLLMALSALPSGLWLFVTSKLTNGREPASFTDNFTWFSKSILGWFFPAEAVEANLVPSIICLWVVVAGAIIGFLLLSRRFKSPAAFSIPVFTYGIFYVLVLFGAASIEYFNKLAGRFLLPFYFPFMTFFVVTLGLLLERARQFASALWRRVVSMSVVCVLALAVFGLLQNTIPLVIHSRSRGAPGENAFNTAAWHENDAMNYWLAHRPGGGYLLFSNAPDGVAFYTWHPCLASPRQFDGPYSQVEIPPASYGSELFSSGHDVYLVWIEPGSDTYYYRIEELTSVAYVQTLFAGRDGSVYRLRPRMGGNP